MTVEYTKNDSKRCPTCGTICIKGAKEFYYCQTCKIDLFDDELKIVFQKSVVVAIDKKTGQNIHRVIPDPMRGYKPPKLRKKDNHD